MRRFLFVLFVLTVAHTHGQHIITVRDFIACGTWNLQKPMATDSVDMNGGRQSFVGGTSKQVRFYINNTMFTPHASR